MNWKPTCCGVGGAGGSATAYGPTRVDTDELPHDGERHSSGGPLDGVRVVDLTDMRGALCARILADLGADVLMIDDGTLPAEERERSAYRYRNANKRRVRLDVEHDRGRLHELLASADVLIENRARRHPQLGLGDAAVAEQHPHLVHVALTDLGLSGRRAGWHLEPLPALASSGALHASGFPDLPPCWLPGYLAHDCASVYGAVGAVAAVLDRARHGRGQLVEVSVQEAALAGTTPWSIALEDYTRINPFLPVAGKRNADGTYWVLPAADGWVRTVIGNDKQWGGFVELLRRPDELTGPEWNDRLFRMVNGDVVRLVAGPCLGDRTRRDLFVEALGLGATVGVIHTPLEFVRHEQTRQRAFFADTGFRGLGDAPFATAPYKLSLTPASLRHPAPAEDDGDAEFDTSDRGDPLISAGDLLLDGVRVVEFGMAAVVPELCGVLSELGADVIKIESLAHPDVLRSTGGDKINCGFAFNAECRGRRSVALDLATVEGRALAAELCAQADIVAENFRGGALGALGLGYEAVRGTNPSVVYVSSQGYGRGGPYGEMPAYGPLNFGFSGLHFLWNHADAAYPCGTSLNHPDHIAGKLLAVAVLAALRHRQRTGEGQLVDMSQTEAAAYLQGEVYLESALTAEPQPAGNRSDRAVPHDVYPCAGEDRWVAIAVHDDPAWQRLVDAVGWDHDPALATLPDRLGRRQEIDDRLSEWTRGRSAEDVADHLQSHAVSAMPLMGPSDHHADAHLREREFIVTLEHEEFGPERHVGNPIRFSRLAQRTAASAPCLGAHTEEVLTSVLGLSGDDVQALVERGVCR